MQTLQNAHRAGFLKNVTMSRPVVVTALQALYIVVHRLETSGVHPEVRFEGTELIFLPKTLSHVFLKPPKIPE